MSPEQAAKSILESLTSMDPEQYRLGHTKVSRPNQLSITEHSIVSLTLKGIVIESMSYILR